MPSAVRRGLGGLHPSVEHYGHCKQWELLMVPKTGSSLLTEFFKLCDCCGTVHWHMHGMLYTPCSLVTLREPCSRAVATYAHLRLVYSSHWPGLAADVNEYVMELERHWSKIVHHHAKDTSGMSHHLVLAMPQYLWVGNASRVLCSSDLNQSLPSAFRSLGCCRVPNSTAQANALHRVREGTKLSRTLNASQANMSSASCAAVRRLYWQDDLLYRRLCNPGTRRHQAALIAPS